MTHVYDRCTLGLLAQRGNRTRCRPTVYRLVIWSVMVVMKVRYLLFEVFCFGDVLSYSCAPVGVIIIILSMFSHSAGL